MKHTEKYPVKGIAQEQRVEHIVTSLKTENFFKINCKGHGKKAHIHRKCPKKDIAQEHRVKHIFSQQEPWPGLGKILSNCLSSFSQ